TNEGIQAGSVIIGIGSAGTCAYDTEENSGIGCNGLTSARHDLLSAYYRSFTESYDSSLPDNVVYCGRYRLTDKLPQTNLTVGQALLSPTRTHFPLLKQLLETKPTAIQGLIHVTGGGLTKCKKFVSNLRIVKDNLFPVPPIFHEIQRTIPTPWEQLYQTFNMGQRLEIFVSESDAEWVIQQAQLFGLTAQRIGYCESALQTTVILQTPYGEFCY
ncbi:MAG: AIR synthase-related protein, partial [Bacteroidia bacterium]|nr:AIR synthase-related protein [Bacteroidia bacterium]